MNLADVHQQINDCMMCRLCLEGVNKERVMPKVGNNKVLIISQNPSHKRIGDSVRGGLDKLRDKELDEMLEDCHITNLVKCSFVDNNVPEDIGRIVDCCYQHLNNELCAIQPERIIVLGSLARQALKPMFGDKATYLYHPMYSIYKGFRKQYVEDVKKIIRGDENENDNTEGR